MKNLILSCGLLFSLFSAYAEIPEPNPDDPADLSYLLKVTYDDVKNLDAAYMEAHAAKARVFFEQSTFQGQLFKRYYQSHEDPDDQPFQYGYGDTGIFTGLALVTSIRRYQAVPNSENLAQVERYLGGLHLLTMGTNIPGVIARGAYPVKWIEEGRTNIRPEREKYHFDVRSDYTNPFTGEGVPKMRVYTRATRDQMTGILFGLSNTWLAFGKMQKTPQHQKILDVTREIVLAIWQRLLSTGYNIEDPLGQTGTNAAKIKGGSLKYHLVALARRVLRDTLTPETNGLYQVTRKEYKKLFQFGSLFPRVGDWFNGFNNFQQYYAWNLRHMNWYAAYFLDTNSGRKWKLAKWYRQRVWERNVLNEPATKDHQSPYFNLLYMEVIRDIWSQRNTTFRKEKVKGKHHDPRRQYFRLMDGLWQLKAWSLRPLRGWESPLAGKGDEFDRFAIVPGHLRENTEYFIWQKEPFRRVGTPSDTRGGMSASTGLSFLLPYWWMRASFPELLHH